MTSRGKPSKSLTSSGQSSKHNHPVASKSSSKNHIPSTSKSHKGQNPPPQAPPGQKNSPGNMEKICNETVTVPPELPDILKQYAKGAMRTQPPDLLRWTGLYFRSMANGETLPVKDRLEFPIKESPDGLTPGLLRVLDTQVRKHY